MEFFPSDRTLDMLDELGVNYVLVRSKGYRPFMSQFAIERLNNYSDRIQLISQENNDFLYRIFPETPSSESERTGEAVGDRNLWKADSNNNPRSIRLAFDGDLDTGWNSHYFQRKGDFFSLDIGEKLPVKSMELYLDHAVFDFPRGFILEGSADGKTWIHLDEQANYFPSLTPSNIQDFSKYKVNIFFEETEVRFLKITLTQTHKINNWSIHEITLR